MEYKNAIKDILITEEEKKIELVEIVKLVKPFIKIEENSGKVIFLIGERLSNAERVILLLTSRFLAYIVQIITEPSLTIQEISNELGIAKTTLSGPLGQLVNEKKVEKIERQRKQSKYKINEANLKFTLHQIFRKYIKEGEKE